jgi:hypothetical protein
MFIGIHDGGIIMKKLFMILLVTIIAASGCTRLPASTETGVKPGEYEGSISSENLRAENKTLKENLDKAQGELEKIKNDYLNLAKNNDLSVEKLIDLESILNILQNNEVPKFTTEQTDKASITNYLNEKKNLLDKNYREINIIPFEAREDMVLFYTAGYGEKYSQMFIWKIGSSEPLRIDGADFGKNGSFSWLLKDKYILIDTGSENEKKVLNIDEGKIVNTFKCDSEIYVFPETTTVLMRKTGTESQFILYDFTAGTEKVLDIDYKAKYTSFDVDEVNNSIIFEGKYKDENDVEYSLKAVISVEKIKSLYVIANAETVPQVNQQSAPAGQSEPVKTN